MTTLSRRGFFAASVGGLYIASQRQQPAQIMTVKGPIPAGQLGRSLIHEHILVDFIGAEKYVPGRWDKQVVATRLLPFLMEAKQLEVKSFFDCTPNFLGRDVLLLQKLSTGSGLNIITNTGLYGAGNNKFLPSFAFTETAEQLSNRWIDEYRNGIDGTKLRPGFIKIGVDEGENLSDIHQKLVKAAALTHLETGLLICSHTGKAAAAFNQIEILKNAGVAPGAFVWVHAQAETDKELHGRAAKLGAWVSLDGIGWGAFDEYADSIERLKSLGLLHRVLISHDAGWYKPDEKDAAVTGYTNIFRELIPRLTKKGFTSGDINQLLTVNPAAAFTIRKGTT